MKQKEQKQKGTEAGKDAMTQLEIKVTSNKTVNKDGELVKREPGTSVKLETTVDFPADIEGVIERFGKEVAYNYFLKKYVIEYQQNARRLLDSNIEPEKVQEQMKTWTPEITIKTPGKKKAKITKESLLSAISSMTEEEKKAIQEILAQANLS